MNNYCNLCGLGIKTFMNLLQINTCSKEEIAMVEICIHCNLLNF